MIREKIGAAAVKKISAQRERHLAIRKGISLNDSQEGYSDAAKSSECQVVQVGRVGPTEKLDITGAGGRNRTDMVLSTTGF